MHSVICVELTRYIFPYIVSKTQLHVDAEKQVKGRRMTIVLVVILVF
jgi:hypothetical protein